MSTRGKVVWREVFLEIALRALKKVHITHTPWHLKKADLKVDDIQKLNNGEGMLLALETAVASEISNEFINSIFTSGLVTLKRARNYEIDREVCFKADNVKFYNSSKKLEQGSKVVDLIVRRIPNTRENKELPPVIMELKRYQLYDFTIGTGKVTPTSGNNIEGIKLDIDNLRIIHDNWKLFKNTKYNKYTTCRIYQLVWGEVNDDDSGELRKKLTTEIGFTENNISMKWFPMIVTGEDKPQVKKWIWLALIEIETP